MAIGLTIALATGINPTKLDATDKLVPRIAQIMTGWKHQDPPVMKKLPVAIDIPELLSSIGTTNNVNELDRAIGDLVLIAFYYLVRIGEYTTKGLRNSTKQTVQFCLQDVTFFQRDNLGNIRQLSPKPNGFTAHPIRSTQRNIKN